jgi:DNA-binding LacI/PurR family transcriptional regulator
VRYDQRGGAALATEHLLALGHREIVHVAGPPDWTEAREREAGWRDAMTAAGVELPEPVGAGSWMPGRGHEVGLDLLRDGLPTAVLAANDHLALGMLRAFAEAGVRVPEDVSVVGFDDVLGSAHFIPPLTTVRHRFAEVGRRCLRMLLHVLAGQDRPADVVGPTLVVRSSTGPPRAAGWTRTLG